MAISVSEMLEVEEVRERLKPYRFHVPRQIRTMKGLINYLESQIPQIEFTLDRTIQKLKMEQEKLEAVKAVLEELKQKYKLENDK